MIVHLQKELIPFNKSEVLRYLGYKQGKNILDEKTNRIIDTEFKKALEIIKPVGIYKTYSIDEFPIKLSGKHIKNHLKNSEGLILLTVTIGSKIDKAITEKFNEGKYTEGVVLDAVATELVEACADLFTENLQNKFSEFNFTPRFSPGYGDWHLNVQPKIIKELEAYRIGISVSDSMFLIPRKTITAVIGITKNQTHLENHNCSRCFLKDCIYRKGVETIQ